MDKMNSDTLINNYLNDGKWEKGIELSQVHNQLEDSFLQHDLVNIKQECDSEYTEYGLPQEVKEELTQISPQFTCVIKKEEPDVGVHDSKLIEVKKEPCVKEDYTENNDVIIEKEIVYVTSGDATNENVQKLIGHCAQCEEDYDLYCIKCPMLSSILDNNTLDRSDERPKHSLPRHTLQIRNGHGASGVYAMKLIPKGTRFGPFDGLDALQMTGGFVWKLNSGKLAVDTEHMNQSNWMQYVNYTENLSHQNVAIFQHNGSLFFRSNRNIIAGEQLLVSYEEEKVKNADDRIYCCPTSEETLPDVYACTVCCLGFSSEAYLREHKAICGYSENKEIQGKKGEDSYMKSKKNTKVSTKSDAGASHLKNDQRQCLHKVAKERSTEDSPSVVKDSPADQYKQTDTCFKKPCYRSRPKRKTIDPVEEKMLQVLENPEVQNRHISFFKGIIPSLSSFNEDDILQLQMGVLQLISSIKKQKS